MADRSRTPMPVTASTNSFRTRRHSESDPLQPSLWSRHRETSVWVEHQSFACPRGQKTEQWVLDQQFFHTYESPRIIACDPDPLPVVPPPWQRRRAEAEARLVAAAQYRRDLERARKVQEELTRIQARIYRKLALDRQMAAAERLHASVSQQERERRKRDRADRAVREAWARYEKGWEDIKASGECSGGQGRHHLAFAALPWPVLCVAPGLEDLTSRNVAELLLAPCHSQRLSVKERIRTAQLRWHPDRFRRILDKIKPSDREAAEKGAVLVAGCLNDLLAREASKSP